MMQVATLLDAANDYLVEMPTEAGGFDAEVEALMGDVLSFHQARSTA